MGDSAPTLRLKTLVWPKGSLSARPHGPTPLFPRALGVYSSSGVQTRLRNQMNRLFNAHVSLIYEDECGKATVNSLIARSRERLTPL